MKQFFAEFKKFISRGNVMDMAVGVIIGGAFTSIVNSLVNDIFMPILSLVTGGLDIADMSISFGLGENAATLKYGAFLSAVINFLLIAIVVFTIVKVMNTAKDKLIKKEAEAPKAPTTKVCPYCKSTIDIGASRCPHCTSELS